MRKHAWIPCHLLRLETQTLLALPLTVSRPTVCPCEPRQADELQQPPELQQEPELEPLELNTDPMATMELEQDLELPMLLKTGLELNPTLCVTPPPSLETDPRLVVQLSPELDLPHDLQQLNMEEMESK